MLLVCVFVCVCDVTLAQNLEGGVHQFSLVRACEQQTPACTSALNGSLFGPRPQGFHKFGFNRVNGVIIYREWAPAASGASLIGDFNNWNASRCVLCCV